LAHITAATVRFRSLVLCYHAVSSEWPDDLAVAAGTIERQLRLLQRAGYRPVSAPEALQGGPRTVHVTFDDAYRNVVSVLPALERLGAFVTIFACTDYADDGRALDVPELRERRCGHETELETMDWKLLRELAGRGVEVGSHTASHPHLPQLGDAELARELRESKQRLEQELRRPCRYLAYPYGEFDERVTAAAVAAGYEAAFALDSASGSRFAVPRVDLYRGDSLLRAALKVSPLRRAVLTARRRRQD